MMTPGIVTPKERAVQGDDSVHAAKAFQQRRIFLGHQEADSRPRESLSDPMDRRQSEQNVPN